MKLTHGLIGNYSQLRYTDYFTKLALDKIVSATCLPRLFQVTLASTFSYLYLLLFPYLPLFFLSSLLYLSRILFTLMSDDEMKQHEWRSALL